MAVFEDLHGNAWDLVQPRRGEGRRGDVLVVIDMQNDFVDHLAEDDRRRVREAVAALVAAGRRAGVPVVWARAEFEADLSDGMLEMKRRRIATCVRGTRGAALVDGLSPGEGELVVVKKRYSAFFGTSLDAHLDRLGAGALVLAGVNTHACVRTTAIDAYQRDLEVVVAAEAVGSHDAEHAAVTLRYFDGKIATLSSNAELLRRWGRDVPGGSPPGDVRQPDTLGA